MPKYKKRKKSSPFPILQIGIVILLAIVVVFTIYLASKPTQSSTHAATSAVPNRILWQGNNWYVHGANMPWYNWGCDFGCNAISGKSGGVSTNMSTLSTALAQAHNAGIHVIRWWVFPGTPWQITTDASGNPNGINAAVYPDFDAALQLAQQYDMYYDFVLFCGASSSCVPSTWLTDTTQRGDLVQALGTLFTHYASNARILSWEIYNEPDFDIWNNKIDQASVVQTATAITQSIHTNSPGTLVTIGTGFADGIPMFTGVGLDYYSPHWYDYMSSGNYCMICNTAAYYQAKYNITQPIVIGEFPTATSTSTPYSSTYRYNYWYNNGYAGEWAWSLFPSRTSDGIAIDMAAATTFASQHADIGPLLNSSFTPTPTSIQVSSPTPLPTVPSDTIPPTVSITSPTSGTTVIRGGTVLISALASDNIAVARVNFLVNGSLVSGCSDTTAPYNCSWHVPSPKGRTYTLTAQAYDSANLSTTSSKVTVTAK